MLDAEILAELEDLLRMMPPRATLRHTTEENFASFGRAGPMVAAWNGISSPLFGPYVEAYMGSIHCCNQLPVVNASRRPLRSAPGGALAGHLKERTRD